MVFQIYRETISGSRETFFDIEYWVAVANRDYGIAEMYIRENF